MDGPQHYLAAERLLNEAETDEISSALDESRVSLKIGLAQVHATMALAAATAETILVDELVKDMNGNFLWRNAGTF